MILPDVSGLQVCATVLSIFLVIVAGCSALSNVTHGPIVNQVWFAPGLALGVFFSVLPVADGFSLHLLSLSGDLRVTCRTLEMLSWAHRLLNVLGIVTPPWPVSDPHGLNLNLPCSRQTAFQIQRIRC